MPPRNNAYITNWLAAYCGDEKALLPQAVQAIKERQRIEDKNGWPLIDTSSENQRLVRMCFPAYIENLAPRNDTASRIIAISSKTVRAIVEPVSGIQFCMRGYLVDLSSEHRFAMRVIEFQRDFGLIQDDVDDREGSSRESVRSDDATPTYAGVAYPKSRSFVGEINFSDFACFELNGFITSFGVNGWKDKFLIDLQRIIDLISPE